MILHYPCYYTRMEINLPLDLLTITLRTGTREEFFSYLVQECPDIKSIIDMLHLEAQTTNEIFRDFYKHYFVIKGHVQSGKTQFMICLGLLLNWFGIAMVFVTRNLHSDAIQLLDRIRSIKGYQPYLPLYVSTSTRRKPLSGMYVCLGNKQSLTSYTSFLSNVPYMVCIDEVDMMDMGRDTHRNDCLARLKQNAWTVWGVSATMMDTLSKETVLPHHIFLLQTPSDYKGVLDITFRPLQHQATFYATQHASILENNDDLVPFLTDFSSRQPIEDAGKRYPQLCLMNICRTIQPCRELQQFIQKEFPTITTLCYNAYGIIMSYEGRTVIRKESISSVLQWLKENGGVDRFPRILILSGDLAGRGISFTDKDYEWHLNLLYLAVSSSCDEPELIQKIRLCGRYNDSIPLELYATPALYSDLLKAYYRQEEIILQLRSSSTTSDSCHSLLCDMTLSREKFTKRSMTKHTTIPITKTNQPSSSEWSVDVYQGKSFPPNEAFEAYHSSIPDGPCLLAESLPEEEPIHVILEKDEMKRLQQKMFPTWSRQLGQTKISMWLDALQPDHCYSKSDITSLCKQYEITLQHVLVAKYEKSGSRGYGKILQTKGDTYQLFPELVDSHKHYFGHY